jgi:hypothetical protein
MKLKKSSNEIKNKIQMKLERNSNEIEHKIQTKLKMKFK